jgi:hypothetical protein
MASFAAAGERRCAETVADDAEAGTNRQPGHPKWPGTEAVYWLAGSSRVWRCGGGRSRKMRVQMRAERHECHEQLKKPKQAIR